MATKSHSRARRSRRLSRVGQPLRSQWLLVLLAHTLATLLQMVVASWLHLPGPGAE
jgi:hypothetical protein